MNWRWRWRGCEGRALRGGRERKEGATQWRGELADKGSGDGGPYPSHHGRSLPASERAAQDKALARCTSLRQPAAATYSQIAHSICCCCCCCHSPPIHRTSNGSDGSNRGNRVDGHHDAPPGPQLRRQEPQGVEQQLAARIRLPWTKHEGGVVHLHAVLISSGPQEEQRPKGRGGVQGGGWQDCGDWARSGFRMRQVHVHAEVDVGVRRSSHPTQGR